DPRLEVVHDAAGPLHQRDRHYDVREEYPELPGYRIQAGPGIPTGGHLATAKVTTLRAHQHGHERDQPEDQVEVQRSEQRYAARESTEICDEERAEQVERDVA